MQHLDQARKRKLHKLLSGAPSYGNELLPVKVMADDQRANAVRDEMFDDVAAGWMKMVIEPAGYARW